MLVSWFHVTPVSVPPLHVNDLEDGMTIVATSGVATTANMIATAQMIGVVMIVGGVGRGHMNAAGADEMDRAFAPSSNFFMALVQLADMAWLG
jgi:hypothetical protein